MKRLHSKITVRVALIVMLTTFMFAQGQQNEGVSIKTTASAPDPSAMLDIENTNKGLLIPRVAFTSMTLGAPVVSPAIGLLVFNPGIGSIVKGFYFWNGSAWEKLSTAPSLWSTYSTGSNIYNSAGGKVVIGVPSANPTYNFEVLTPATTETASARFYSKNGAQLRYGFHDDMLGVDDGSQLAQISGFGYAGNLTRSVTYAQISATNTYTNIGIELVTLPKVPDSTGGCYIAGHNNELFISSKIITLGSSATLWPNQPQGAGFVQLGPNGFISASDSTLKKQIIPENAVLSKVMQLKPVTFRYKNQETSEPVIHGLLAQEVNNIYPELITTLSVPLGAANSNAPVGLQRVQKLGVNYNSLTTILLKAIQEQQVLIDDLKRRVALLEK